MPLTCIILNCGSRANRDPVKFYAVPKVLNFAHLKHKNELSKLRREMWLSAIKRNDLTDNKIKHQRVCSKHFLSGKPATLEDKDDLDWIPSQNLGHTSTDFRKKPETSDRSPTNFDEPSSNVLKLDMPGCAAINCSNSNAKGFLMKKFPTDPVRRKEWVDRMKRDKWMPTKHSCICEVHFEQQMWEKTRVDGRRTLKCSAVPTLFCFSKPKPARKPRTKRVSTTSRILKNGENLTTPMDFEQVIVEGLPRVGELSKTGFSTIPDIDYIKKEHDYTKNENLTASMDFEQIIVEGLPRFGEFCEEGYSTESEIANNTKEHDYMSIKNKSDEQYKKALLKVKKYKALLRNKSNALKRAENAEQESTRLLKSIFSPDQILALKRNPTKFTEWSNATIQKALKLKLSCGADGYKELLKQKIPLPSLTTLSRLLQK